MNTPPLITLLAAAADNGNLHRFNAPPPLPGPPTSPDPAIALLLQLAHLLLPLIPESDREQTPLFLATTLDSLTADIEFDRSRREAHARYASPAAFARTLPSTPASELSVKLRLQGPTLTWCTPNSQAALKLSISRAKTWMRHIPIPYLLTGTFESPPATPPRAALLLLTITPTPHAIPLPPTTSIDALITWINSESHH